MYVQNVENFSNVRSAFLEQLSASSNCGIFGPVQQPKHGFKMSCSCSNFIVFTSATARSNVEFSCWQFAQEEAAEAACREHYHEIKGKMVEAKKAQPKEAMTNLQLKKWSYGTTSISGAPADPGLPFYLSSSQRNPMFANNPANPYNGQFHPNFAYSPVMNYPGSPTFQVGSPIGAAMGSAERTTTPNHFLFGDLIASPFNGQLPTRPTTMSPSPLDSFARETFLSTLPYMSAGSPRATAGGITSPPLTAALDTPHEFAGILATSPQTTGFQFGSPFGFGTVPPAMVAAYQGYNT